MFRLTAKLCLLRARAEEVPYSVALLLGAVCVNFSVLFLLITLATTSLLIAALKSILVIVIIASYTALVLQQRGFPERFTQAVSGMLACASSVLAACLVPYTIFLSLLFDVTLNVVFFVGIIICVGLIVAAGIWLFVIFNHILYHALEVSLNQSLLVTLGMVTILLLVFGSLYWFLGV